MDDNNSVLVIDDETNVRESLIRVLQPLGIRCMAAAGGNEALDYLRREQIDVALLDLKMPEVSGLEVLAAIREENIPTVVVVLSGFGQVANVVEAMKYGAFDFLEKPAAPNVIQDAVTRAVEHAAVCHRSRRMEKLVKEWEATFNASPDVMLITDQDFRIVRCNSATATLAGVAAEELLGKKCHDLLCGPGRPGGSCPFAAGEKKARPTLVEFYQPKWKRHFEVRAAPIAMESGLKEMHVIVARDVTERNKNRDRLIEAHRQLRIVRARISRLEEDARRNLAQELHDRVGQMLTALGINLSILRSKLASGIEAPVAQRFDDSLDQVAEIAKRVRDVMSELRPSVLDDYGLLPALLDYAGHFSQRTGIEVVFSGQDSLKRLDSDVETGLFRIVQEALTNVAKHARAGKAIIGIENGEGLRITVGDDGAGFDSAGGGDAGGTAHWGISIMRERAAAIGGSLTVESEPGKGTRIMVELEV